MKAVPEEHHESGSDTDQPRLRINVDKVNNSCNHKKTITPIDEMTKCGILLDKTGRITDANEAACVMFQRIKHELVGGAFEMLIPGETARRHREHLHKWFDGKRKARLAARDTLVCPSEAKGIKKDGTLFSVSMIFNIMPKKGFHANQPRVKVTINEVLVHEPSGAQTQIVRGSIVESEDEKEDSVEHKVVDKPPREMSRYETDFEVIKVLGTGNFGAVLKCQNRLDKEFYAIKQVKFEFEDKGQQESQLKEIAAMAKLGSHPNIVRYFSSWIETIPIELLTTAKADEQEDSDEDCWGYEEEEEEKPTEARVMFIQMELSKGISLDSWLMQPGREMNPTQSLYIFIQIVDALNFVHNTGIIHRDLKPENILMESVSAEKGTSGGQARPSLRRGSLIDDETFSIDTVFNCLDFERMHVKLVDFGLATTETENTLEDQSQRRARTSVSTSSSLNNDATPSTMTRRKTTGIGTKLYAAPEQLSSDYTVTPAAHPASSRTKSLVVLQQTPHMPASTYDDKADIFPLGLTLVELFCPPAPNTVRQYLRLNALRDRMFPEGFEEKFPREAALARELIDPDPNKRPNTHEVRKTCLSWLRRDNGSGNIDLNPGDASADDASVKNLLDKIEELEVKNKKLKHRVERLSIGDLQPEQKEELSNSGLEAVKEMTD